MSNSTQNILRKKIHLKSLIERQQNKLLKLIYKKRKITKIELLTLKKQLKTIKQESFRKIQENETQIVYEKSKKMFEAEKTRRLNEICINLTNEPQYYLSKTKKNKKIKKLRQSARYWIRRKKKNIPHIKIYELRPHKRKKAMSVAPSLYATNMKRWTKLSEKRAKSFMAALNKHNQSNVRTPFATFMLDNYRSDKTPIGPRKLILNKDQQRKYKNLKRLKKQLLSKISREAFIPASKYKNGYNKLTDKQVWVAKKLMWLQIKSQNKVGFGIDFFKTILGQTFLNVHNRSHRWEHKRIGFSYKDQGLLYTFIRDVTNSSREIARKFQGQQERAWYYTNTVFPKKLPYYFQKSSITNVYPFDKFKGKFHMRKQRPWLDALISKRTLYNGYLTTERREFKWLKRFSWIPSLNNKPAFRQKKNKIYYRRTRLMYDSDNTEKIYATKKARIKQLVLKSTLPFYGNLTLKQFRKINKKAHSKKSTLLSSEQRQLKCLDLRLDVVVYRLNLAPSILWARRLIKDGCVFVSSTADQSLKDYAKLYGNYKQNAYPLKLRDPQNLYKKTTFIATSRFDYQLMAKMKFLLEPLRNINYLTEPGDVIFCAPGSVINQHKSNINLWQKPLPSHLLSISNTNEVKEDFKPRSNALFPFARKEQTSTNVGFVLFNPSFSDLYRLDRVQRSFLRWMTL